MRTLPASEPASCQCPCKGTRQMDGDECSCSPASAKSPLFRVGQNSDGDWVVEDDSGRYCGIFVDRSEAVRYALFENGHLPHAVVMVPGIMELDMSRSCGRI